MLPFEQESHVSEHDSSSSAEGNLPLSGIDSMLSLVK